MASSIYYLPGRGGRLNDGLGAGLSQRGLEVRGRELLGPFKSLPFREQVSFVADDIQKNYWHEDARIIANSFGAYLFLNAMELMPRFIGKALLLSPIIGEAYSDEHKMAFVPPLAGRLFELAEKKVLTAPENSEIHVGEHDWQSDPKRVQILASMLGIVVKIVPNSGHTLDKEYVSKVIDAWL